MGDTGRFLSNFSRMTHMLTEGSGCRSPEVGMSSSAAGQWGRCIREPEGPHVGGGSQKDPMLEGVG